VTETVRIPWAEWKALHEELFTPDRVAVSHTGPIKKLPRLRNWTAVAAGGVVEAARWVWRMVLRFSDWVDRNASTILAVIVAVVLILGVTLVLAFYGLRFPAILFSLFGLVGVTAVVAYKAGASR
jgi:hypothetical protein